MGMGNALHLKNENARPNLGSFWIGPAKIVKKVNKRVIE